MPVRARVFVRAESTPMPQPIFVALSPCSRTLRAVASMVLYALLPVVLFAALTRGGYVGATEGLVSKVLADADDTLRHVEHVLAPPRPRSPPSPPLQSDGALSRENRTWEESRSRTGVVPFDEAAYGAEKSAEARAVLEGMRALCTSVVEAGQQSKCQKGKGSLRNWIISMLIRKTSDSRKHALQAARDAQLLRCGAIVLLPPLERLVETMGVLEPGRGAAAGGAAGGAASGAELHHTPLRASEAKALARKHVARLSALHRAKFWETHPSATMTPDHWLYLTPDDVAQLSVDKLDELAEHHARRKTVQLFKHFGILPARQCVECGSLRRPRPFACSPLAVRRLIVAVRWLTSLTPLPLGASRRR